MLWLYALTLHLLQEHVWVGGCGQLLPSKRMRGAALHPSQRKWGLHGSIAHVCSRCQSCQVPLAAELQAVPRKGSQSLNLAVLVRAAHACGCSIFSCSACASALCRIKLPIKMPTACTFGGSTLGDLYITTADLGGGLGAGGLWRFRLDGLKGQAGAHFTKRGT